MKRALLISYHFPPSRAAGAVRWGSFTAAGVSREWSFDVVTFNPDGRNAGSGVPHEISTDGSVRVFTAENRTHWALTTVKRVSAALRRVRRNRPVEPSGGSGVREIAPQALQISDLPSLLSPAGARQALNVVLRHLMFTPWADAAARIGRELARTTAYDVVISSGPPHMAAVAARSIAVASNIPLVLDFRDPWSTMDVLDAHSASVIYPWIARYYERQCVDSSALVIANTERAGAAIQAKYPDARIIVIPNGYDGVPMPARPDASRFTALYAGAIYLDRDPRPIFRALQSVRSALSLTSDNFVFRLVGECEHYGGVPIEKIAESFGIGDLVETHPALARAELYKAMADAAMLVNLPQGAKLCIPSKLYEYAQFPSWILAIEPPDSATRDLLAPLGADVVESDPTRIAQVLEQRIREFRTGARAVPLATQRDFSFGALATRLFTELDQLTLRAG